MRLIHYVSDSFLDFIEHNRFGEALFRLARLALFGLVVLVAGKVASGQFLSLNFDDVLFIAIAGVAFMLVFARWEIGIIIILGTTSFIVFYSALPTLSLYHFIPEIKILEPLRLQLGQGLMLFLLAVFAISRHVVTARQRLATPLTPTVLLFLLAMFTAAIVGVVFNDVRLRDMVETSRPYSFYLMFFVVLLCVRGRRELSIIMYTLYGMSLIVALLMFVQFAVGDSASVFIGRSIRVEMFGGFAGRILPPGLVLIWMITPFVLVRLTALRGWPQRLVGASLGLLLGGLLLTFTRSVWMGVLLSMAIMAILGRGAIRRGMLRMFVVLAAFVGILLAMLSLVSTDQANYVTPYVNRFLSTFQLESYTEGSSGGVRFQEFQAAWPKIQESPWLGIGIGAPYRYTTAWDKRTHQHYLKPMSYIHNNYVRLLTKTGIIGLGACLLMYATFFMRARMILRRLRRPDDRALVMACIGWIAAVMLASMMQPSLWHPSSTPLIGMIFAIVELLRYFQETEEQGRELAQPRQPLRRVLR